MPTEQDLRAALTTRERLAPEAAHVLVGLPARVRRRRARSFATAIAVTVAVAAAIGTPMALSRPHAGPATPLVGSTTDPHAADRPPFSLTLTSTIVDGYKIRPDRVTNPPIVQEAAIVPVAGGDPPAGLVVYPPGVDLQVSGTSSDSSWPMSTVGPLESSAQVNGAPAVVTSGDRSGVRWEYAPDAWAILHTIPGNDPLDTQILLDIAAGVRFVDPYPVQVPFRLDYLPAGLSQFSVLLPTDGHGAYVAFDGSISGSITVTDTTPFWPGYADWQWTPTVIAGLAARCSDTPNVCELTFGGVRVLIGGLTASERDQVVAGVHLATLGDPSTWFDVVGAIPGA